MYKEKRCVDECPNELKLTNPDITKGTCLTCAEATATEDSPNGERPFWDPVAETCVTACEQTSVNSVCETCEKAFGDSKKYFEADKCVEYCSKNTYLKSGTNICGGSCASGFYEI